MNSKNYLNSEFLNTAAFYKAQDTKTTISYLEWCDLGETDVPNEYPTREFGIKMNQKDIYCDRIIYTKDEKNSFVLINALISKLYDLYVDLANQNEKSISKTSLKPKSNFLTKWIKGNSDLLIEDTEQGIRKLITRILHISNSIAANNRIGPATFIIISPKLLPIIQNTPNFVYDMSGKIKEYETISQVGKLMDLSVFVNFDSHDDTILVGRYSSQNNLAGVALIENDIQIDSKYITWIGAIDSYSDNSKYMFDLININIVDDLPWYKRIIYKFLKKRNMI